MKNMTRGRSPVAIVSSCSMVQAALQSLIGRETFSIAWQSDSYAQCQQNLCHQPVDLLIVYLPFHPETLSGGMSLLHLLHETHPELSVFAILEQDVKYLNIELRRMAVKKIFNIKMPLKEWQTQFNALTEPDASCHIGSERSIAVANDICKLSRSEKLIIYYLAQGYSLREVASKMVRNLKTIAYHKNSAMKKLGIEHYSQFVAVTRYLISNLGPEIMPTSREEVGDEFMTSGPQVNVAQIIFSSGKVNGSHTAMQD
ncbi:LuxR C-terminal-related transcriptional regulator [Dryocola clanedunensis]